MELIGFFSSLKSLVVSYPIEIFILIGVMLFLARIFSGEHMKRLRKDIKHKKALLDNANKKGRELVQKLNDNHQKARQVYQLLQQTDSNLATEKQANHEMQQELDDAQAEIKQAYRLLNQAEDNLVAEREARMAIEREKAVLVSIIHELSGENEGHANGIVNDYETPETQYVTDHELPAGLQMSQGNFTQQIMAFLEAEESRSSTSADVKKYSAADDMWSGSNGDEL